MFDVGLIVMLTKQRRVTHSGIVLGSIRELLYQLRDEAQDRAFLADLDGVGVGLAFNYVRYGGLLPDTEAVQILKSMFDTWRASFLGRREPWIS